jgi:RES domain
VWKGCAPSLSARRFFTVDVDVTNLLDLRVSEHRDAVALDLDALRGPWEPCQRVGLAAHQLGLHGIIAPAATRLGLTLALFEHNLPAEQWPTIAAQSEWAHPHPTRAACARSTSSPA